ncbi:MAG: SAM-dependent chlorinase/fluorinase [Saprospiraceae bacterium]|nr:SAM-dependent chlorinase/fluorinase [Saprospiraceae bacterium]MDW8483756.1 SAM-dependent chlorinase/fluorinase [Saprospiraceae bacterium]
MLTSPIVSLTTDFGLKDYYTGALKGALLNVNPTVRLVDISHAIRPFDIVQAALTVQHAYPYFPAGTIHLIGVNCAYAPDARFVLLSLEGHFFAAPDNGVLTLMFGSISDARVLPVRAESRFPVIEAFANAVSHLSKGQSLEMLGQRAESLTERIGLRPVTTRSRIRGTIVHIDNFENAHVNIRQDTFERIGRGRPFSLFFKRHDPITRLSGGYADVPVGEPLCLFNSAGYLEIAVNMGRAATLFGLKEEDVVEVVFED